MLPRLFRSTGMTPALPDAAAVHRRAAAGGKILDEEQCQALRDLESAGQRSVYLWGAVGRGKSWLLEEYFTLLPEHSRQRVHLHTFLGGLQSALADAPGKAEQVIAGYRTETRVLLFDEFLLHDVADAHLLNRWLPRALAAGVRILATSNYPPQRLLPDPLFHDAALPVIRAIETGFHVIELGGTRDHRLSGPSGWVPDGASGWALASAARPGWITEPLGPSAAWTRDETANEVEIPLGRGGPGSPGGRSLRARLTGDGVYVVEFSRLCEEPLSARDYLDLARRARRWVVTGVPGVDDLGREPAQRWAHLVDVLYDERVDVIFESECSLPSGEELAVRLRDAERFVSRLRHLAERPFA
ncbi:cell division protein ZapE [Arthrobacter woluwensis]|uniref:cell division protein ZapE n=1 Tax=Arthrobacter woluwensis TaxID=156980 RepID=UPI0027890840|nr:cell division protein ZapE [Arthrobacter woluwensis]MDQ0708752.1 cell division protein ZapE [Arthrobacter woluwensis]